MDEIRAGILPEPNHADHVDFGTGPAPCMTGPYDTEIGDGVTAQGYEEKRPSTRGKACCRTAHGDLHGRPELRGSHGLVADSASGPIHSEHAVPDRGHRVGIQDNVEIDGYGYTSTVGSE